MKTAFKVFFLVLAILEVVVFIISIYKMILDDYIDIPVLLFLALLSIILIYGIYYDIKDWRKL